MKEEMGNEKKTQTSKQKYSNTICGFNENELTKKKNSLLKRNKKMTVFLSVHQK